ncbi:MAG TPA: VWA domain-containing protein [Vicinamibacterales bacterium]|nr:VWA domain-containing protein [Vicinamibacterales bacterium]
MTSARFVVVAGTLVAALITLRAQDTGRENSQFRFRSGIELINVTATVSDVDGRFVPDLTQDDFVVYEDDKRVDVTHFSAERVPVSLGIALDTSGSMAGEKIEAARAAIRRFVNELLDRNDELFLYRFSNYPVLVQGWTRDRRDLLEPLDRFQPNGATAMYDTVARAIPLAQQGQNRKKALVVISDGNDTSSRTDIRDLKEQIRQSEVLVYAVGIDSDEDESPKRAPSPRPPRIGIPIPRRFPGPVGGGIGIPPSTPPPIGGGSGGSGGSWRGRGLDDHVNVTALRELTDDSGGRTELIRSPRDLDPATASIADELSKQYYLGYPSPEKKDGRWHTIRVDVRGRDYRVRARRGYFAN